jgi:Holliday junction resolvase
MANPNGRKGATFERAVADAFLAAGWEHADRRPKSGARDRGDIGGVSLPASGQVCIEVKNEKAIRLATYVTEARLEAEHAGARWWAAVVKQRGKGVGEAYVVRTLAHDLELLTHVRDLEERVGQLEAAAAAGDIDAALAPYAATIGRRLVELVEDRVSSQAA